MKNRYILWCMAALTLSAACSGPELEPEIQNPDREPEKVKQTITIKALEVLPEEDTKAIHGTESDRTSFSWQAGIDKIGVIKRRTDYGEDQAYWDMDHHRFTNTTDGSIATFVYDIDEKGEGMVWGEELTLAVGEQVVAYYPYATAASSWYDSSKPYLMSSHCALLQRGDNNTDHLFRGDFMFSKVITLTADNFDEEGNVNITMEFGHVFSKMKFSVKNSTDETLDIHSLVYRSTKEDDVMQGTLTMDGTTGEFIPEGLGDWGIVPPTNSAVLETEDISIAPGETATLWMWLMPLDFTAENVDRRTADIMINTNKGVFRVENKTFNAKFEPGQVYRQGLELTTDKLHTDFAYISDPNFARILLESYTESTYNEETQEETLTNNLTLYDMSFQPLNVTSMDDIYSDDFALKGGSYVKLSEAAEILQMHIQASGYNALSFDGLQYFTGLTSLIIETGSDMNMNLTMKALKLGTLVNLEELVIANATQMASLDLSNNTKLKVLNIRTPRLETLIGLEELTLLEEFNISEHNFNEDLILNLKNCTVLKSLIAPYDVKVDISGLNLDYLEVSDARNIISTDLTCKSILNGGGHPFPSGAPKGVETLELRLDQGDGQPSMFSQFSDMTDIKDLKLNFFSASNDYAFTSAQSSIKTLEIYQPSEPVVEIPKLTGWSNLTGVETLYINKDVYDFEDYWSYTESDPLDLSGMTSLQAAKIRVKAVESMITPSSLKTLELSAKSAISFTPTGIVDLNLDAQENPITLGDSPALTKVVLYAGAEDDDYNAITIGSCPMLEDLTVNVSTGRLDLTAASYPALKKFRISEGKNISSIPSAEVFPAIKELSISGSGYGSRENGIGYLDATQYTHLNKLYIGGLDDGYAYRNYNNRYYTGYGYAIRSKGSFVISESQYNAAKAYTKANSGSELFSGISGMDNAVLDGNSNWVNVYQYQVNSIYKVLDDGGNEITITDDDYSDGEVAIIVYSETN